jgi:hypothetical protein
MSIQGVFTFSTRVGPSSAQNEDDSSSSNDPTLVHLVADVLSSPLSRTSITHLEPTLGMNLPLTSLKSAQRFDW